MRSWIELGRKKIIEAPGPLQESRLPTSFRHLAGQHLTPLDAAGCRLVHKFFRLFSAMGLAGDANQAGIDGMNSPAASATTAPYATWIPAHRLRSRWQTWSIVSTAAGQNKRPRRWGRNRRGRMLPVEGQREHSNRSGGECKHFGSHASLTGLGKLSAS